MSLSSLSTFMRNNSLSSNIAEHGSVSGPGRDYAHYMASHKGPDSKGLGLNPAQPHSPPRGTTQNEGAARRLDDEAWFLRQLQQQRQQQQSEHQHHDMDQERREQLAQHVVSGPDEHGRVYTPRAILDRAGSKRPLDQRDHSSSEGPSESPLDDASGMANQARQQSHEPEQRSAKQRKTREQSVANEPDLDRQQQAANRKAVSNPAGCAEQTQHAQHDR